MSVIRKINYWAAPYVWKKKPAGRLEVLWQDIQKPFKNAIPDLDDQDVVASIVRDNEKWEHKEYILKISGNLIIDPKSGFLIDTDGTIIRESIVFDHYGAYPEKLRLPSSRKITELPEVVIYDHFWSKNYFHFYSDVFTKLHLINTKSTHLKKLPLIVSREISETRTFKFFSTLPVASEFNWYVQDAGEIIRTQKAHILQPMPYATAHWMWVKDLVKDYLKPFDPNKKIFINRPAKTGRYIANFEEIRPVLEEEGFEIAEMENKTIEEQIALLSSAGIVASIHGAAMANILFCDPRTKILEVTAAECVNSHYYWLATALGLQHYDCLTGTKMEVKRFLYPKGRFFLDPQKTREYLKKIKGA